jgi:hypothetical protein
MPEPQARNSRGLRFLPRVQFMDRRCVANLLFYNSKIAVIFVDNSVKKRKAPR